MTTRQNSGAPDVESAEGSISPSAAYHGVMRNIRPALTYIIASTFIVSGIAAIPELEQKFERGNYAFNIGPSVFLMLLFILAVPTLGLAIADRRVISIRGFFRFDARRYFNTLAVMVALTIVVAGPFVALFLVPELRRYAPIIVVAVFALLVWVISRFSLAPFITADTGSSPLEAARTSNRMLTGRMSTIWGVILPYIVVVFVVGIVARVIDSVISRDLPVVSTFVSSFLELCLVGLLAMVYRQLQPQSNKAKAAAPKSPVADR